MQELGKKSKQFHKDIFDFINRTDVKKCIFICNANDEKYYSLYLNKNNKFLFLNDIKNAGKIINKFTREGDCILIKGSRVWELEKIIKLID